VAGVPSPLLKKMSNRWHDVRLPFPFSFGRNVVSLGSGPALFFFRRPSGDGSREKKIMHASSSFFSPQVADEMIGSRFYGGNPELPKRRKREISALSFFGRRMR